MKKLRLKIYHFLLRYIFSKIVKQGNNRGIADIYRLLYLAHEKEFTEDGNCKLFMIEIMDKAIELEQINRKIKINEQFDFQGSISYSKETGFVYKS